MIETATARREAGDWAGACAAAGVDIDFRLRSVVRHHGRELAARIRADLRQLAPDLLRWHLPRIAPHGLLRPGLTIELARYDPPERDGPAPLHLVVRTPPAWADAGQRISLALWDGSHTEPTARRHPHPRPNRRFRLDLHRHLWDARRADELRIRSGLDDLSSARGAEAVDPDLWGAVPPDRRCAVDRWAAEAAILLRAEGQGPGGAVSVRLGGRMPASPAAGGRLRTVGGRLSHGSRRRPWTRARPHHRCCRTRPPGCCPTSTCSVPGRSGPVSCTRWSRGPSYRTCRRLLRHRIVRVAATGRERRASWNAGGAAPDRPGRRGPRPAGPRSGRGPPRRTAGRPDRHSAALPPGHRRGAPAAGLPHRCARTSRSRGHRRCAGRRRGAARSWCGAARRSSAGRTGGRHATADHLRTVPCRPARSRPHPQALRPPPSRRPPPSCGPGARVTQPSADPGATSPTVPRDRSRPTRSHPCPFALSHTLR